MRQTLRIENIEVMRRHVGIDDVALREGVSRLQVGDCVYLTLLSGVNPTRSQTVSVRIVTIEASGFRGRLLESPTTPGLSDLMEGSMVTFAKYHVHSLPRA